MQVVPLGRARETVGGGERCETWELLGPSRWTSRQAGGRAARAAARVAAAGEDKTGRPRTAGRAPESLSRWSSLQVRQSARRCRGRARGTQPWEEPQEFPQRGTIRARLLLARQRGLPRQSPQRQGLQPPYISERQPPCTPLLCLPSEVCPGGVGFGARRRGRPCLEPP